MEIVSKSLAAAYRLPLGLARLSFVEVVVEGSLVTVTHPLEFELSGHLILKRT